ncbi:MAG: peroxiredoxin [Bacteroidetes bacterium]|jgi:peroxiredoxin (alkyl hydroperoxide reductase subunit C)|nr:peroxiredoxin [Bacteroidota bacterium]MBU1578541.1 peroxiredoxin [Bacteroidota bacterium]MBU2559098.1 peroxiredoxin [Bacteroidota bacterium]MDA3944568.1 peroxiredoxin [Bacteroidota bacterium]
MSVLVGKKAPLFEADAVLNGAEFTEKFSLEQYIGKKHVVFFFYPMDFTFVCPTEILAFQEKIEAFEQRNVAVVGCSVDSKFSHLAWLNMPKEQGGIAGVTYPLVSDFGKTISANFDVLAGEYDYNEDGEMEFDGEPVAYRGLFLIDKQGVVRHQVVNDLPLGRSIDETIRMIDALQFFEENGEVCPANWKSGDDAIQPNQEGINSYLSKH